MAFHLPLLAAIGDDRRRPRIFRERGALAVEDHIRGKEYQANMPGVQLIDDILEGGQVERVRSLDIAGTGVHAGLSEKKGRMGIFARIIDNLGQFLAACIESEAAGNRRSIIGPDGPRRSKAIQQCATDQAGGAKHQDLSVGNYRFLLLTDNPQTASENQPPPWIPAMASATDCAWRSSAARPSSGSAAAGSPK